MTLRGTGLLVGWCALIVLAMSIPLSIGTGLAVLFMAPWFLFVDRHSTATVALTGVIIGMARASIVLGPLIVLAERPIVAWLVCGAYAALLHLVFAVLACLLTKRGHFVSRSICGGALVVLLDTTLCLGPIPLCQLTTAYVIAGNDVLLQCLRYVDPLYIGLLAGAAAVMISTLAKAQQPWLAALVVAGLLSLDVLPMPIRTTRKASLIVAVPNPSASGAIELADRMGADLIVLPENVAIRSPLLPAEPQDLPLEDILTTLRHGHHTPVLTGVVERGSAGDYRNIVLLRYGNNQSFVSKRRGIPGHEVALLKGWPVLEQVGRMIMPVEAEIHVDCGPGRILATPVLQLAACTCFDHSCCSSWRAWGIHPGEHLDLLLCIARLSELGGRAEWEWALSRRARRIHAAVFGRPLLYVTDCGSELVLPDGRVQHARGEAQHLWSIEVP